MTKPKLFGISGSRALRAIWGIEETGIDYEHVPVSFGADSKSGDYLAVNPNGRIPALVDGDVTLFESMAINLYLAKVIPGATKALQRPLKVLDTALAGRNWLIGDAFTVADLNVAAVMHLMKDIRFDYSAHANVQRWVDACYARPALARALAKP